MALPTFPTMGNWFAGNDTPYNKSNTLLGVGLGLLSGKTAQDQVGQAASNFANERQMGRTYNKTLQFLQASNPQLAQAVEAGALSPADAYKLHITSQAKADRPRTFHTLPDGTYGFADPDTVTFNPLGKAPKPSGSGPDGTGAYYGTTIPYYDANGTLRYKQLGKDGNGKDVDFGGGVAAPPTKIFDTGTEGVILAPGGRQTGAIQKNVAGEAAQKEIGDAQGKAIAAAPGDLQAAQNALDTVQSLRNDPNKGWGTGLSSIFNAIPGSPGKDFQKKVDQSASGAFLTAIQQMRGLGSLSNAEGATATAAVARMDTATSEEEFNAALNDYEKIVKQGAARAQARIQQSGGQVQAPPSMAPAGGNTTSTGVPWSMEP
ncbi:hypothetical protein HFO71_24075 [Rhizobium laguerreae]|uniref:hypothetical protein n=1 Tax=Rhizobium laguerreae TaxID=1076926 RepID=UPI001C91EFA8|nr:hypothetical protein [Rhizobium laguerreae]MBY3073396.1 hypothetical protein [Rhizobium laguerreae]